MSFMANQTFAGIKFLGFHPSDLGDSYQVPMRSTAPVVTLIPFWARIMSASGSQECVYSTFNTRHANARVNTRSKPLPAAMLKPYACRSTDQSKRLG